MKLQFKQPIIHGSLPSLPSLFISIGPFLSSFCPQLLLTSLHDLYSDSHFNYCSFFYLKAPSCICFSICSLLRPLISVCFRLSPFFLLMWVQTASCGPCVFFFFLHREQHVSSCERALPEDGASSTDTVSSRNFSKALLSPLEERRKKKMLDLARGSTRFFRPPPPSLLLPPFLLKTFCLTELFPASLPV